MLDAPNHEIHPLAIKNQEDALGRAVLAPLVKDEQILDPKLASKGAAHGSMSVVTRPGMRAFTIQTTTLSAGVAGFVVPGDHVDVLLSMSGDNNDGTSGATTTTLLQYVEVMAVDEKIDAPAGSKIGTNQIRSVTLQVTPDRLVLDLGQTKGILALSLRNPADHGDAKTRPAT